MTSALYSKHKETIENFSWRSIQMFGRYGVTAIIFFAAAKLLSPEEFGLLNYLRTIFFLLMIFCDFGLSYAVGKFVTEYKVKESEKLNKITFTIVAFSVGIAALISAAVILFGHTIFKENYRYILSFLPYLFLMPLTNILDGIYRGLKEFKKPALINSIVGLISIVISVVLISRYLLIGAIWSINIMYLLLFVSLCRFQKNFRFEFDRSILVDVLKYALVLGIGAMAGYLYSRASILILGQFNYIVEIGYFGLIDSIVQLLFLPFAILGQVIAPNTTAYIAMKNFDEIKKKMKKYAIFCVGSGIVLAVLLYSGMPILIKIFFAKYNTANFYSITNIMLILVPIFVWNAILNQGFMIPAGFAKINVITTIAGGILNVILAYILILFWGFIAVFWVLLCVQSATTIISTLYFVAKLDSVEKSQIKFQQPI